MKQATLFLAIVIIGCSTGADARTGTLSGTYRSDCAPYDGPAFQISLPAPSLKGAFLLRADVPLEDAVGNWKHVLQSQPGEAHISFCETGGKRMCHNVISGSFRVNSVISGRMTGSIEARFSDSIVHRFAFAATTPRGVQAVAYCR